MLASFVKIGILRRARFRDMLRQSAAFRGEGLTMTTFHETGARAKPQAPLVKQLPEAARGSGGRMRAVRPIPPTQRA